MLSFTACQQAKTHLRFTLCSLFGLFWRWGHRRLRFFFRHCLNSGNWLLLSSHKVLTSPACCYWLRTTHRMAAVQKHLRHSKTSIEKVTKNTDGWVSSDKCTAADWLLLGSSCLCRGTTLVSVSTLFFRKLQHLVEQLDLSELTHNYASKLPIVSDFKLHVSMSMSHFALARLVQISSC